MASERAQLLSKKFSGKDEQGRFVNVSVNQSNNATMIWEYNTELTSDGVESLKGKQQSDIDNTLAQAMGITDSLNNTQVNKTQVNVASILSSDKNGNAVFDDKNARGIMSQVGVHEDGHSGGLQHENKWTNTIKIIRLMMKDKNNLMLDGAKGTKVLPEQRSELINKVEKQQPN